MSMRYKGGVLSPTALVTSGSSATGMWTMRQQLQAVGQTTWPFPPPSGIGQAYGGGFYAGQISTTGDGVATHYLVVAPKASGEHSSRIWGVYGTTTGQTNGIYGPSNSAALASFGMNYQAAVFCNNLNNAGGLNGYTDWYLPSKNELEVLYYFLKPTTEANFNYFNSGSNANAVSPEPINTSYTEGSPAQTSAVGFRTGEANAFVNNAYWSSTELNANEGWGQGFHNGAQSGVNKGGPTNVRAVRRIAVQQR
jgi:hypothetical protein